jgi:hypothetical protein
MSGEGEGFLSRWSRRKRGAAEPEPMPEPMPEVAPAPPPEPQPEAAERPPAASACPVPGVPQFDLASLPRIEELTVASDLGPFLKPGVPAALRAAALRRMWSLDPAIRDYIGPVEYQWDFNTPGGLPTGFASELGGNVKKLLAQAIGLPDEDEKPPEEADPAQPPVVELAQPADEPPPALPDSPLRLDAPPAPEPAPEPEPVMAEESALPRRRHGSALPS